MQFRPSARQLYLAAMAVSFEIVGNQLAFAVETLPEIIITAPRKPLADQINNSQQTR